MRRVSLALIGLLASSFGAAALDLTPMPHDFTAHGIAYRQLKFNDGERTVVMDLPNRWTFRGSSTRLQLTPPEANFAEGVIEIVPVPPPPGAAPPAQGSAASPPAPFDDTAKAALERQALASAPPGSQSAALVSKHESVVLGGRPGFEVVISFDALGDKFRRSITFVNLGHARMMFQVTAKQAHFEQISNTFYRGALSLTWE